MSSLVVWGCAVSDIFRMQEGMEIYRSLEGSTVMLNSWEGDQKYEIRSIFGILLHSSSSTRTCQPATAQRTPTLTLIMLCCFVTDYGTARLVATRVRGERKMEFPFCLWERCVVSPCWWCRDICLVVPPIPVLVCIRSMHGLDSCWIWRRRCGVCALHTVKVSCQARWVYPL